MRVLVCGSRHFNDYEKLKQWLDWYILPNDTNHTIIHGAARGTDTLAGEYGREHQLQVQAFPADWDTYGKRAGPIRNSQMLKEGKPDLVIAFLAPNSRGTKNMIDQARKAGVETVVIDI